MSRPKKQRRPRKKRREKRKTTAPSGPRKKADEGPVDLRVRHPEYARPPVYIDASGHRLADPFASLGLDPQREPTPEEVQSAFLSAIAATPPETDPQRARELLEARDFFLDPKKILARTLGDLRVPDPAHFLPGFTSRLPPKAPAESATRTATDWPSRSRLVAILTLYALLEEELCGATAPKPATGDLFSDRES